jgi:hypothetical protein
MYMYPSTRMLARSQAPHTFTFISFGYDMLTAARKGTSYLGTASTTLFSISHVQQYEKIPELPAPQPARDRVTYLSPGFHFTVIL